MSLNPNFIEAVRRLYPNANFLRDVVVQDNADGKGPFLAEWNLPGNPPTDAEIAAAMAVPAPAIVNGATFFARVTDAEYQAIVSASASNVKIARWIELLRLNGEINVNGATAQAAKAGLVAAGLLTQPRADVIFAA